MASPSVLPSGTSTVYHGAAIVPGLHLTATVVLRDVDHLDSIPERTITLEAPDWKVKVGRGSLSSADALRPTSKNAWFDSRVMSRNHAVLRANPYAKTITIEDVGSMHGTHLGGRRLKTNHAESLWPGDIITLGCNVTRGSNCFNALQVEFNWHCAQHETLAFSPLTNVSLNTFSPEYSEGEYYGSSEFHDDEAEDKANYEEQAEEMDNDVDIVQDSVRQASVEVAIPPPRTFAVPESDVSEPGSYTSGADSSEGESPSTSPIELNEEKSHEENTGGTVPVTKPEKAQPATDIRQVTPTPLSGASKFAKYMDGQGGASSLMDVCSDEGADRDDDNDNDDPDHNDEEEYPDPSLPPPSAQHPSVSVESSHSATESNDPMSNSFRKEAVRAPSPSDAAMAKPSTELPLAPPFMQKTSSDAASVAATTSSNERRSNFAWAGYNSVLYEPSPGNFGLTPFPSTASLAPPAMPPLDFWPQSFGGSNDHLWGARYPLEPQDHLPKIPISSILDQELKEVTFPWSKPSSKRKADQIASDTMQEERTAMAGKRQANDVQSATAATSTESIDYSISTVEDRMTTSLMPAPEAALPTPKPAEEMPPRKKAKKNNTQIAEQPDTTSGNFVKLAAAAVAGMAVGTVGTIIGLAALPADYFT
ncbi:hypothetical protein ABEF92_008526 [Exophiala dermatitidis]|uniref:FHA domain-containing protein n=1 Tax=Exophiala dermatitidis (strain ATCC 34100 / CBS 525.76 / NIH/UT8656) TaxID=858893 RepID=H6C2J6_EXODN|nr:uncharacterized protein HMPREF1120_06777 [Exophiala dermatitidis NIH/UT8656]EHY58774.1 hypothetical protein HMPREF1120_06777 [Exophiala dermatitidis NIH/UT8656]